MTPRVPAAIRVRWSRTAREIDAQLAAGRRVTQKEEKAMPFSDTRYLEETMERLIKELKKNNCLSQDFEFLTKAEREHKLERFVNDFIRDY